AALPIFEEEAGDVGRDHELLASAANSGQTPDDVAPYRFAPPVSPHLAAELAGVSIEPAERGAGARGPAPPPVRPPPAAGLAGVWIEPAELVAAARAHELVVCEGVGGLLVPITPG